MTSLSWYSLQQRVLASDCELGFLRSVPASANPDIVLRLCTTVAPPRTAAAWYRNESSVVIDRAEGGDLVMRFPDGTAFLIDAGGRAISLLSAPPQYTLGDLAAYALGPVIAIALHLQGAVLLHASAVVIGGSAVLFAGPAGSGKSTTAAILHRQGYSFLADDLAEIAGDGVVAAQPAIRLWPDVLDALYGNAAAFPDRAPSWDKKIVSIGGDDPGPHRLAAILFLEPELRAATPHLERLGARAGWQRLIAEARTVRLPDPRMERRIFKVTSALADRVPMYSFAPPLLAHSDGLGSFLESALR